MRTDPAAVPDTECTPWETMARDVASVRFDYFNSVHTNLGTPGPSDGRAAITRVTWTIRLERIDAALRWQLLASLDLYGLLAQQPALQDWVEAQIDHAPAAGATGLRLRVAEMRLQRGDGQGMQRVIGGGAGDEARAFLPLLESLLPARQGRFAETVAAFTPARWR